MAAMTTALTEYSNNGTTRTYSLDGHTAQEPSLVIQTRRIPSGKQTVAKTQLQFIQATRDAEGHLLAERQQVQISISEPIHGTHSDLVSLLAKARDVIASDEFTAMVETQNYIK